MQAAPPYLPGEITDIIISFIPDSDVDIYGSRPGYSSLCSCALVCRNWLPASRHTLFTHVEIRSDEQYALFVSSAICPRPGPSWLLSTRRFSLHGQQWRGLSIPNAQILFIHELGGQFPNLEELHLQNLEFYMPFVPFPSPRTLAALSAFASVRIVVLRSCSFSSFAAARYTITSLPSLTDLTVAQIMWPIARNTQPPQVLSFLRSSRRFPFLKRVRRLEIWPREAPCDDQMLQWLSTTSLDASLADLTVRGYTNFTTKVTGFWEYAGSFVTRLRIWGIYVEGILNDST